MSNRNPSDVGNPQRDAALAGGAQPLQIEAAAPAIPVDVIRLRAYEIYLRRSGGPGDELSDWLQAEFEVRVRALGQRDTPSAATKNAVRPTAAQQRQQGKAVDPALMQVG